MITVYSMETGSRQEWQAELLEWSHKRAGVPGDIIALRHPAHHKNDLGKVTDMLAWACQDAESTETVLFIDADFVFVKPFEITLSEGHVVGHPISYVSPVGNEILVHKYCSNPSAVQGVGCAMAMQRKDWAKLSLKWMEKTLEMKAGNPEIGWITDMWSYIFAVAECNLRHEVRDIQAFPAETLNGRSMIHYCYDMPEWNKHSYTLGDPLPDFANYPEAGRQLLQLLTEYNAVNNSQHCIVNR